MIRASGKPEVENHERKHTDAENSDFGVDFMTGAAFMTDRRLYFASEFLRDQGHAILTAENAAQGKRIASSLTGSLDFLLPPIRGTEDGGIVLKGETVSIDALLRGLSPGTPVFTGLRTGYLESLGLRLFNPFEDEAVARANAPLTAEGVLWFLLEHTPRSIYESTYDVIGQGRTGTAISDLLHRLGLNVRRIGRKGDGSVLSPEAWHSAAPADVVISTATTRVIARADAEKWRKPVFVLDIASGQAGVDPAVTKQAGVTYFAAPPLPGIVAPESAGKLIADYIIRILEPGTPV